MFPWKGLIEKYKEFLPVTDKTPIITLKEGNTPLIHATKIEKMLGNDLKVYLKFDGVNPSGSFKDRGMTMAISKALEEGSKAVMCASTGNTSASAAAYAARANISCAVLIPEGNIALGKLAQALIHGAKVIAIQGNFDEALELAMKITDKYPITLVNSLNPYRIQGQKTGAFEIIEQLEGIPPDYHAIPVGNAGNITAYWMGYKEWHEKKKINKLPKMIGFQSSGSAPIVLGHPVKNPETVATAIRIGNPVNWKTAEAARDESGGLIDMVTDEEITDAQKLIANSIGVFCEPASAASVAGVIKMNKQNYFDKGSTIVCILTGHGLKDPKRAIDISGNPISLPPKIDEILKTLGIN